MEIEPNVKTLPVGTASTSKAYITYNPAKFDIIPVTGNIGKCTESECVESARAVSFNYENKPKDEYNEIKNAGLEIKSVDCTVTKNLCERNTSKKCEEERSIEPTSSDKDENSFSIVFQDIHAILNDSSCEMNELSCNEVQVKSEPENCDEKQERERMWWQYPDSMQSTVSEKTATCDNFEMVYVKCEPGETDSFYIERQKNAERKRLQRQNESPDTRARRLVQVLFHIFIKITS